MKNSYEKRIEKVKQYIKAHLSDPLDVDTLAEVACFSKYHFHRIFTAMTNESLYSYIKRHRIQKAAGELVYRNKSITEIALDCGYESQASFCKAFKQVTNKSASQFRNEGVEYILQSVEEAKPMYEAIIMKPEIKVIDEIKLLYLQRQGDYNEQVTQAWIELLSFARKNDLIEQNSRFFGIPHDNPNVVQADKCRYDACISLEEVSDEYKPLTAKSLSGGRYAVFYVEGEHVPLEPVYNSIFRNWLPNSGEELRDEPHFQEFIGADMKDEMPVAQAVLIYIPLQ